MITANTQVSMPSNTAVGSSLVVPNPTFSVFSPMSTAKATMPSRRSQEFDEEDTLPPYEQPEKLYPRGFRLFLIAFSVSLLVILAGIEGK